ncbi:hypothetical protein AB5I41_31625 [Sphingomonas sp. MMS24-JH45]
MKAVEDLLVDTLDMPNDRYMVERDQSIEGAVVTVEGSYVGEARPIGDIIKPIVARLRAGGGGRVRRWFRMYDELLDDPRFSVCQGTTSRRGSISYASRRAKTGASPRGGHWLRAPP